jgi:hypothetical protein
MSNRRLDRDFRYWVGDIVYRRLALDKEKGMITHVIFDGSDTPKYKVMWAMSPYAIKHTEIELTSEYIPDYDDESTIDDTELA